MAVIPKLRVLFFDVFGTCVAQRPPVADELWKAAKEALESDVQSINPEIRANATGMTYEHWFDFGGEWNKDVDKYVRESIVKDGTVQWRDVDEYRMKSFKKLLSHRGLVVLRDDVSTSELHVQQGSLWDESHIQHLGLVWHRLPPWPDTCSGLDLLNKRFATVTLSNTYKGLMESLVAYSSIPFQHVYTSDMFESYKPNPKVYLGAAEKMGVRPEECGLVAAHLKDLKGAKACGFHAIYVERSLEEKDPELESEDIPDMRIGQDEGGFVALAKRLDSQDS